MPPDAVSRERRSNDEALAEDEDSERTRFLDPLAVHDTLRWLWTNQRDPEATRLEHLSVPTDQRLRPGAQHPRRRREQVSQAHEWVEEAMEGDQCPTSSVCRSYSAPIADWMSVPGLRK